ncbi:DNA polymerase III subunit gamma/tau [Pelosinus propionicus]|uniref:DNA-directed DNA polymerase n=1 Tax=Pelosinus propionicus DSM 13327 TaxID=1123291 RepID=A0A1I4M0I1_9FIRM|nr:DNA polymerase III subunit gamma/tau [Pelosinus propionicus]SFL96613.1 DNA polymerase-3 subunit gamma/tau [Pelosinus propionicus DSM 13327]
MAYVALYRQWRPQDFDNLVGQSHISVTLRNAIISKKIAHAYLFSGPRGTGKTSTAKILAKSLNCIHGPTPEPCNVCLNCQSINTGTSMDVFEIDAASNRGIDEIRELRETVKFAPVDGRYKVYIIDEVHMLTTEAFNALLKTLEEPPAHVVFILATTEAHKIPATIHSRCQRYDFRRIDAEAIESRLAAVVQHEGLNVAPDAIKLIASHADGGLRDALSILDQCTTMENGIITAEKVRQLLGLIGHEWVWRVTEAIAERDFRAVLMALGELIALGKEVRQILLEVALYMRSIMLFKAAPDIDSIELYGDDRNVLAKHGGQFKHDELIDIIKILNEGANDAKWAPEPRITAEMTLLSICRRSVQTDMMNLLERIAILEAKVGGQSFPRMEPQIVKQVETVRPPTPVKQVAVQPVVSPKLVEKIEIKQEIAHEHHQTEPVVSSSLPSSDVKEIWDNVLKELVASGKRSVHACVSQGKLISLDDKQAIVQFAAAFPKERTEKEDYRIMIEKVLTQFCGKTVQLCCILGSAKVTPKSSVAPPKEKPVATVPSLEEEVHPALRQAIHMFGGKVTKKEE